MTGINVLLPRGWSCTVILVRLAELQARIPHLHILRSASSGSRLSSCSPSLSFASSLLLFAGFLSGREKRCSTSCLSSFPLEKICSIVLFVDVNFVYTSHRTELWNYMYIKYFLSRFCHLET
ncbi:hypothetical protein CEXT_15231 [Caerostris extrusa]|uniref:Secreted protein n=1 Tax=Caerostris extrusa TaxID=172846 RepID=A0AAV4WVV1_CAEEX|nr:hypothetical protein CEXT_15231 [Caerostris extrusa]